MRYGPIERDWRDILKREPCVYCGRRPDEITGGTGEKYRLGNATLMTIEHIVPKHQPRRPHGWENLAPACWNCNNTRGSMTLLHYLLLRQHHGVIDTRFLRTDRRRRAALTRARRRLRAELPPPLPLTTTIGELVGEIA